MGLFFEDGRNAHPATDRSCVAARAPQERSVACMAEQRVEGNNCPDLIQLHIHIIPPRQRPVREQQKEQQGAACEKSSPVEYCGEHEQDHAHEFDGVAEFKVWLRIVCDRDECHVQHDL